MNFFDDIKTRVEQSAQNYQGDIKNYIQSQIVTPAVKIGKAATGNLSEAEIKQGRVAEAPPIAPADSMVTTSVKYSPIVLVIGAIAVYFLFLKKGRK